MLFNCIYPPEMSKFSEHKLKILYFLHLFCKTAYGGVIWQTAIAGEWKMQQYKHF